MGWVALAVIGLAAFGLMWALGVPRSLASFTGAALMFGAAGYALQQNADVRGRPVEAKARAIVVDPGMVAFRDSIMPGSRTGAIVTADDRLRAGNTQAAVRGLLDALARRPNDASLWTALGDALSAHDSGQVSPASLHAFRRAIELAPDQPGPLFFLGMAHAQAGDLGVARQAWSQALRLTPPDASYRRDIAARVMLIDEIQAAQASQSAGASGER